MGKTNYQSAKLNLSKIQLKKLMTGQRVRLNKKSLTGGQTEVHLNKHQLKRLARIDRTQKGGTLSFSDPQIRSWQKSQGLLTKVKCEPKTKAVSAIVSQPEPAVSSDMSEHSDN